MMDLLLQQVIKKFIENFKTFVSQGFKFALIGLGNTFLDYAIYISLTRYNDYFAEHYLQANIIAFIIPVTISYFLNKYWTFKDSQPFSWLQLMKFIVIIAIGSLVIVQVTLYISVEYWQIYDLIGKALGIMLGFMWNFLIARKLVFNN